MSTLAYRPDLDGLRAVAVISVIAFHFGFGQGGPGGVTVFFALSGFLITSLLLSERSRTGTIDLPTFYRRRARRLLPPATVAVLVTLLWAWSQGLGAGLGRQAVAALSYWSNWERYGSSVGYGDSGFAPFTHYWSLAIEEQFYLILPAVAAVCLRAGRKLFGAVLVVGFAGSALYATLVASDPMSYYDTGARVCELLAGSLLALVWQKRTVQGTLVTVAGWLSLAGLVWALLAPVSALVVSGLTLGVIVGAPSILASRPLVAIGKVSYGLYLFHPLALLAAPDKLSAVALLIGMTLVSYYTIERPIRFKLTWPKARAAILTLTVATLVTACIGPYEKRSPFVRRDPAPVVVTPSVISSPEPSDPGTPVTVTVPAPPIRISVAGDSTMTSLGLALHEWSKTDPAVEWVAAPEDIIPWTGAPWYPGWGLERPACGLLYRYPFRWRASDSVGTPEGTNRLGGEVDPHEGCDWHQWIPSALARMDLDVLVVSFGPSSVWEHQIDGKWLHAGQPKYDQTLADTMDEFERMAAEYGTAVIWTIYPNISADPGVIPPGDTSYVSVNDPAVMDAVARITQARPCWADLRGLEGPLYYDTDHFTPEAAARAVPLITPAIPSC